MKRLKNIVIIGACALIVSTTQAANINIENPSFESSWNGWADEDPSAISGDSHEGNHSAKIEGSGGEFTQEIAVSDDTNYVLKAWVSGKGRIGAVVGTKIKAADVDSSTWEQATVEFNSGSNETITIFGRYSAGTGRFDSFTLESLD